LTHLAPSKIGEIIRSERRYVTEVKQIFREEGRKGSF
jgi:hypothetical protein